MDFSDEIPGFLIESSENLAQLDLEMVELEKKPGDDALIASVFRTIHTLKGTSGFFGFSILGSITHVAENILGQVREKLRPMTPEVVSLILETVDAVRLVLASIEGTGAEGADHYQPLRDRLERAYLAVPIAAEAVHDAHEAAAPEPPLQEATPLELQTIGRPALEPAAAAPVPPTEAPRVEEANPPRNRRAEDQGLSNSTIRVDVSLLDKLMNLVGEVVLARNQILQGGAPSPATNGTAQRLNLITSELQEGVMRTRMQPIGGVWNKLPRVVRDLAAELGKKIEMEMEGAETELDKTIIEAIKDPLTHIVRNSCDHGIELPEVRLLKGKSAVGMIRLRAFHEGGHVNIEIADDGAGIDPERIKQKALEKGLIRPELAAQLNDWEALRLIFLPGFSTAEKVTGISGRGVGMDVVKTNIEKISGAVDLTNRAGGGSIIKIKIPLTLAIIPGLIVSLRNPAQPGGDPPALQRFVIPQANLLELVRLEGDPARTQVERIHGIEVYRRRGKLLPLAYLSEILGLPSNRTEDAVRNIVVLKAEETAFGLVVDEVNDTQEIVVKALGKQLKGLSCYLGATIMGDGRVALILDVNGIALLANVLGDSLERMRMEAATESQGHEAHQLLLFRVGRFHRMVLDLSLVARLEEIAATRTEYAAGSPVVRYRETILPLISLRGLLDPESAGSEMQRDSLQVVVFEEAGRYVGLVVDEILDILDERVTVKQPCTTFGLLGSGVVGGRIADFVDLEVILAAARTHPATSGAVADQVARRVLLVEPGKFERGLLRSFLEMQGLEVVDCATAKVALEQLERRHFDVVVSALALEQKEAVAFAAELRGRPELASLRFIGLTHDPLQAQRLTDDADLDLYLSRSDRSGLARAIRGMSPAVPTVSPIQHALAGQA